MQEIVFVAREYQHDQSFQVVNYRYSGSVSSGWTISRNDQTVLQLGEGYVPVQTLACGICATDLVRHKLPFPLPQISGHEVTGLYDGRKVAIEINASHQARNIEHSFCVYCQNDLASHCPERMTLGIDRLPGGFAPWVLAPVNAIHYLPDAISEFTGVLIEPFAAALQAVFRSPPQAGDRVAVLGPRRLGMLILAALYSYRLSSQIPFEIIALMRHPRLHDVAKQLGADDVMILEGENTVSRANSFDIVFDTTGSVQGFDMAVSLAGRTVHIKSTHGQSVQGLENITSMVINEQQLKGLRELNLVYEMNRRLQVPGKTQIYISPAIKANAYHDLFNDTYELRTSMPDAPQAGMQQFDMALVSSIDEINRLTRAYTIQGQSLLRARGCLLLDPDSSEFKTSAMLGRISQSSLDLATSRCGSFAEAIRVLQTYPELTTKLERYLITEIRPVSELAEAFRLAASSEKSIKLVIDTSAT